MAKVIKLAEAKLLGLAGRQSREIVSGAHGAARQITFRLVEIATVKPGDPPRTPHVHDTFEECIHVVSGVGVTETAGRTQPVGAGDTILIPAGEPHFTRNTGTEPLVLMCFFPIADVASGTRDLKGFD
jgi:mannose-6-phosphate isomerase-like protein (cupin superfamily)